MTVEPLDRVRYAGAVLSRRHPPRFAHPHKAALFALACPDGCAASGEIEVTRWAARRPDPLTLSAETTVALRPGFYDYTPEAGAGPALEWHVNFADPELFVAYGSSLLAQDEMQVAEHPVLACVREALVAEGRSTRTDELTGATPILVRGAERRIGIATEPDAAAGRPHGLYGGHFAVAPFEVVRRATRRIEPPTISNVIAMAAPCGGWGEYDEREIAGILVTALTGFAAARDESVRAAGGPCRTVVHSGFWGCGAFGGNRRLMVALQVLAARAAGLDALVIHAGPDPGPREAAAGLGIAASLAADPGPRCDLAALAAACARFGFRWGVSDGN